MYQQTVELLAARGITLDAIAEIVLELQRPYIPDLQLPLCLENVQAVLMKREVQHAVLTGLTLDMLAEEKKLPEPLQQLLETDNGLYGIDEVMALAITGIYGSIGLTNFGYLDKTKPAIIGVLNRRKTGQCHTFADDLVCAIAAAACSRLAHSAHSLVDPFADHDAAD